MIVKKLLFSILNAQQRLILKRTIRRLKSKVYFWVKPMTLEQMESILTQDLKIKKGDRLFVTSAFGSLNARFSPKELIELLMRIVGEDGNIMMPFYPLGSSHDWVLSGKTFDMKTTKSSRGIVTNVFSAMPNVVKSQHPTKAVCVWGKGAEEIAFGHSDCATPFAENSPYGKFYLLGSKSIGLAADACPMGHCMEDLLNPSCSQYYPQYFEVIVKDGTHSYNCKTLVHDMSKLQIAPRDFIKSCSYYRKERTGYSYSYAIDNNHLFNFYKTEFLKGRRSIK